MNRQGRTRLCRQAGFAGVNAPIVLAHAGAWRHRPRCLRGVHHRANRIAPPAGLTAIGPLRSATHAVHPRSDLPRPAPGPVRDRRKSPRNDYRTAISTDNDWRTDLNMPFDTLRHGRAKTPHLAGRSK
jgi:hypothetical protein